MADEDALFAEFMGEIKSTVVSAEEPQAAAGEGDDAASDTASVGDTNANVDHVAGGKDAETTKRKGEVRSYQCSTAVHSSNMIPEVLQSTYQTKYGDITVSTIRRHTIDRYGVEHPPLRSRGRDGTTHTAVVVLITAVIAGLVLIPHRAVKLVLQGLCDVPDRFWFDMIHTSIQLRYRIAPRGKR